jgi:isopentenyl diphosphate isomerase/L-lactate dehydrogenase-like FMN-dependent dehydrogenase
VIYHCDVGALIVDVSRYYNYAWKYEGEEKVVKLFRCLLRVLRQGVFVDIGAYVGFYTVFGY